MTVPVALDPRLATFATDYLAALYCFNPLLASLLGLHEYDGQIPDYADAPVADRVAELDQFIVMGDAVPRDGWSAQDVRDWTLLTNAARSERRLLAEQREHRRNPLFYDPLFDVTHYLKRDYAPLAERVDATIRHLDAIPDAVATADANLAAAVPASFLTTALETVPGVRAFIADDLLPAIGDGISPKQHTEVIRAQARAVAALDRWQAAIAARQRAATDSFAIGADAFAAMLRWDEMVTLPLDALLAAGEADLAANLALAREVAAQIAPANPTADVATAMASIGADHPTAASLVPDTRAMLESLRQFLIDHEIVTVPSDVRCRVEETPPFLRWASAMMDSPGPLDERATEAFYYVTPVDPAWSPAEQEEWLRTLNYTMLRNTSVHEAYPGHYVHSLHNRLAPTQVSRVFGAYSFWEAWAHYSEEMMIEQGLGDGDPRGHLAQLGDALLRNVRYVCAIRMHTMGMTVAEAMERFRREAFLEPLAAEREAVRGTFDPGYLCYTLGKLELRKLRRDVQRERGDAFTLKQFHDDLLSFGAPPLALVRTAMLRDDDGQVL